MTNDFVKVVRIGTKKTYGGHYYSVFATISYEDDVFATINYDGGKLSITGVEGPRKSGNCAGSCGQIESELKEFINFAKGWSFSKLQTFRKFWKEWHLNHMVAGSPRQEEYFKENGRGSSYGENLEALQKAGLSPDAEYIHNGKPYVYGSAWLKKEVPEHVLVFLKNLPDADRPHPWGK